MWILSKSKLSDKVIKLIPEAKKILDRYRNLPNDSVNENDSAESSTGEFGNMNAILKYLLAFIMKQVSDFGYKKLILLAWNKLIHPYLKKLAEGWASVEWDDAIVEALDRLVNNFCNEEKIKELEAKKIETAKSLENAKD